MEKQKLPGALAGMILGIVAIVTSCYIAGLILGIIGLSKSKKALALNAEYPETYTGAGMAQAGKVCSIIGIIVGAISIVYWVVWGLILGTAAGFAGMF